MNWRKTVTRTIFCEKLKKESAGLDFAPYPGALGKQIYEHISKEAWQQWISRQTMFINEYRLNLADAKARKMLEQEMEKFLFSEEDNKPEGFNPID